MLNLFSPDPPPLKKHPRQYVKNNVYWAESVMDLESNNPKAGTGAEPP